MKPNCQIHLTGHIDVPADRLGVVAKALPEHIRLTLAEPDCLSFTVTPDPSVQGRFLVDETFASREAFEAHQLRAKSSRWSQITEGLQRSYTIRDLPA